MLNTVTEMDELNELE